MKHCNILPKLNSQLPIIEQVQCYCNATSRLCLPYIKQNHLIRLFNTFLVLNLVRHSILDVVSIELNKSKLCIRNNCFPQKKYFYI